MKFRIMQAIFVTGPWFFKGKLAFGGLNFQEYSHHNSRALDLGLNTVCVFIFFLQTVSKYMNGLLNTKGGVLVFGVRPKTGIPLQPSFLQVPPFLQKAGLSSNRTWWPLAPSFCSRATRKSKFFHTNYQHWAHVNFPQSIALKRKLISTPLSFNPSPPPPALLSLTMELISYRLCQYYCDCM